MNPGILDHLFVVLVLGLIFPFGGWWAYRRFLVRLEREGGSALVREYRITLIWLGCLGAGAILVWLAGGRALSELGLRPILFGPDEGFVLGMTISATAVLLIRPILAARNSKIAAALRAQFSSLEAFLPKTRQQLFWGLLISVAAGVFEEIAYRGYLVPYFATWLTEWGALAASSLLFGFAHFYQGKAGTVATTLLGAAFGWIYLETGSLLLPILLHALFDISAMVTAWIVLRDRDG